MTDKAEDPARRDFLKLGAVSAPAALAAATMAPAEAEAAEESPQEGLRKTAHVKAYLESARF